MQIQDYIPFDFHFLDIERVPLAIAGLFASCLIGVIMGPIRGNANPLYWHITSMIFGRFGDKLDRSERNRADLIFRGFLLTMLVLAVTIFLVMALQTAIYYLPHYSVVEILILMAFISCGQIWSLSYGIYNVLHKDKPSQGAYFALAQSTRFNFANSDDHTIIRATLGFLAKSLNAVMVAPLIWYIVAGIPGIAISSAFSALNWRFGKLGFSKGFGGFPAALDKLLSIIPAFISYILIKFSSIFVPKAKSLSFTKWPAFAQGGAPISAIAESLHLSLGGPYQTLSGSTVKSDWIGKEGASAKAQTDDLKRGIYLIFLAHILFVLGLCGLYLYA